MSNKKPQFTLGMNPENLLIEIPELATKSKSEVIGNINQKRLEQLKFIDSANAIQQKIDKDFPVLGFTEYEIKNTSDTDEAGELAQLLKEHFVGLGYDVSLSESACVITADDLLSDDDDPEDKYNLILHIS